MEILTDKDLDEFFIRTLLFVTLLFNHWFLYQFSTISISENVIKFA
jgi:hypothetical protein